MVTRLCLTVSALTFLLAGCSADDGRPSEGTGTGGGTITGGPAGSSTATSPSSPGESTPAAGAKKALLAGCTKDDECASNACFIGDQGSYCSMKCTPETAATACAAPLAGTCNKKGFCKKP